MAYYEALVEQFFTATQHLNPLKMNRNDYLQQIRQLLREGSLKQWRESLPTNLKEQVVQVCLEIEPDDFSLLLAETETEGVEVLWEYLRLEKQEELLTPTDFSDPQWALTVRFLGTVKNWLLKLAQLPEKTGESVAHLILGIDRQTLLTLARMGKYQTVMNAPHYGDGQRAWQEWVARDVQKTYRQMLLDIPHLIPLCTGFTLHLWDIAQQPLPAQPQMLYDWCNNHLWQIFRNCLGISPVNPDGVDWVRVVRLAGENANFIRWLQIQGTHNTAEQLLSIPYCQLLEITYFGEFQVCYHAPQPDEPKTAWKAWLERPVVQPYLDQLLQLPPDQVPAFTGGHFQPWEILLMPLPLDKQAGQKERTIKEIQHLSDQQQLTLGSIAYIWDGQVSIHLTRELCQQLATNRITLQGVPIKQIEEWATGRTLNELLDETYYRHIEGLQRWLEVAQNKNIHKWTFVLLILREIQGKLYLLLGVSHHPTNGLNYGGLIKSSADNHSLRDAQKAREEGDLENYRTYMQQYPKGLTQRFADEAQIDINIDSNDVHDLLINENNTHYMVRIVKPSAWKPQQREQKVTPKYNFLRWVKLDTLNQRQPTFYREKGQETVQIDNISRHVYDVLSQPQFTHFIPQFPNIDKKENNGFRARGGGRGRGRGRGGGNRGRGGRGRGFRR